MGRERKNGRKPPSGQLPLQGVENGEGESGAGKKAKVEKVKNLSGKERLRRFFRANIGRIITTQDVLRESGLAGQHTRRLRELREEGWDIPSHNDLDELKPGQYKIVSAPPKGFVPPKRRNVSKKDRAFVLERDGFACQKCGAGAGEIHPHDGRRVRLQIGHIVDRSHGGEDDVDNYWAECSLCNEGSKNLAAPKRNFTQIRAQLRNVTKDVQRKALEFLLDRLGEELKPKGTLFER